MSMFSVMSSGGATIHPAGYATQPSYSPYQSFLELPPADDKTTDLEKTIEGLNDELAQARAEHGNCAHERQRLVSARDTALNRASTLQEKRKTLTKRFNRLLKKKNELEAGQDRLASEVDMLTGGGRLMLRSIQSILPVVQNNREKYKELVGDFKDLEGAFDRVSAAFHRMREFSELESRKRREVEAELDQLRTMYGGVTKRTSARQSGSGNYTQVKFRSQERSVRAASVSGAGEVQSDVGEQAVNQQDQIQDIDEGVEGGVDGSLNVQAETPQFTDIPFTYYGWGSDIEEL